MREIKLYQTVKLITDKYEESGLKRGTFGTILEIYDEENFEIEWYDMLGNVIYMCAFNIADFEVIS